MKDKKWNELTPAAKKWVRGWIAVLCKDLSQKIIWHDQIDDTMLFYFHLPSFLTKEQFEKTDISKDIKVDWENDRFIITENQK